MRFDAPRTPANQFRLLRSMVGLAVVVIIVLASRLGHLTSPLPDRAPAAALSETRIPAVRVLRAVDGDTILVDLPDDVNHTDTTRVRVWGINCPETAHEGQPDEPFGPEAARFTQDLLAGAQVTLEIEPARVRDTYGRLLAHVDLDDGTSLAARLLAQGLTRNDPRWPHSRMQEYARIEKQAKDARAGLWARR